MEFGAVLPHNEIGTDPGAMKDFHNFCEATGDVLESATEDEGVLTFVICKA